MRIATRTALLHALVLAGCAADVVASVPCTRTADCASGLVCALGRCRVECVDSRDCPVGARCLIDPASGTGVCSLAVIDDCTSRGCPTGLVCQGGQCLNACGSIVRCPDGVCVGDACLPPTPMDAGLPDAGVHYRVGAATSQTSVAGGTGGSVASLACPPGTLLVGYQALFDDPSTPTGSVPHAPRIACAPLGEDGALGHASLATGAFGVSDMARAPTLVARACAPGTAVVGLVGGSGDYCGGCGVGVFALGLECAPVPAWTPAGRGIVRQPLDGIYPTMLTPFELTCPASSFVDAIEGRAGQSIDQLSARCRAVETF